MFVLTAKEDEKDNGCIINTAIQAASEPNQLSICVNKANYTHDMIKRTGKFTVSVLSQSVEFELFKHFGFQSGRNINKFEAFDKLSLIHISLPDALLEKKRNIIMRNYFINYLALMPSY